MVDRAAPRAIDLSGARRCRSRRPTVPARSSAPAATDRFAPMQFAIPPGVRQKPLPEAEIDDAKTSWLFLPQPLCGMKTRSSSKFHQVVCDKNLAGEVRLYLVGPGFIVFRVRWWPVRQVRQRHGLDVGARPHL